MRALLLLAFAASAHAAAGGTTCVACGLIFTLLEQPSNGSVPTGASPDATCASLGLCDATCALWGPGEWPAKAASPAGRSNGNADDQRRARRALRAAAPHAAQLPSADEAVAFLRALQAAPAAEHLDFFGVWTLVARFLARGTSARLSPAPLELRERRGAKSAAAIPPPCDSVLNVSCDITRCFDDHLPLFDADDDGFGAASYGFRGASWRGRDCGDADASVYPGRHSRVRNASVDHNCNGISGGNASVPDFEAAWCSGDNAPMSVVILGDSAAAHFSIPPQFTNARELAAGALSNLTLLLDLAANEADWPECSWATGFRETADCPASTVPMGSIYQSVRSANLCSHRHFVNIGVNGARVTSMSPQNKGDPGIINSFTIDPANDAPALVFYALIGNDVCNGHPGGDSMTTVDEFQVAVLESLDYLHANLPKNSHVAFLGLVDGRVLWHTTHKEQHPLGMNYPDLYNYLACNGATPCWGWLNSNETWRNFTSERAQNLTNVCVAKNAPMPPRRLLFAPATPDTPQPLLPPPAGMTRSSKSTQVASPTSLTCTA
jgi:hypothetical protein